MPRAQQFGGRASEDESARIGGNSALKATEGKRVKRKQEINKNMRVKLQQDTQFCRDRADCSLPDLWWHQCELGLGFLRPHCAGAGVAAGVDGSAGEALQRSRSSKGRVPVEAQTYLRASTA